MQARHTFKRENQTSLARAHTQYTIQPLYVFRGPPSFKINSKYILHCMTLMTLTERPSLFFGLSRSAIAVNLAGGSPWEHRKLLLWRLISPVTVWNSDIATATEQTLSSTFHVDMLTRNVTTTYTTFTLKGQPEACLNWTLVSVNMKLCWGSRSLS